MGFLYGISALSLVLGALAVDGALLFVGVMILACAVWTTRVALPLIGMARMWPELLQMDAHGFRVPALKFGHIVAHGFILSIPWESVSRARSIVEAEDLLVTCTLPDGKQEVVLLYDGWPSPWGDQIQSAHLLSFAEALRARGVPFDGPIFGPRQQRKWSWRFFDRGGR